VIIQRSAVNCFFI